MTTLHNHTDINATPQQVWGVLADLDRLADYDPVVTKSIIVGDSQSGLGAKRRCDARQGRYFVEEVTAWEPCTRLQFSIIDCNLPTTGLTHTYNLQTTSTGTRVAQVMNYDMRFGLLGKVLDAMMVKRATDRGIKGFLVGLKSTVENSTVENSTAETSTADPTTATS